MLVLDLDGDNKKEFIISSMDGYVTVVNGASYQTVWDKNIGDYMGKYNKIKIHAGLAAADLNNDGKIEIVIATGAPDITPSGPGAIVVLTYVGGSDYFQLMPGWPVFARDEQGSGNRPDGYPDGFTSTPSLGDIDGDGDLEIVVGGMDRRLHAFYYDGTYLPGWPLDSKYRVYRDSRSTASLADLDGDGVLDIFIGTNNYSIPNCPNPYLFYGLKADTTLISGFPVETTQNIESAPAIGDINGDGSLDIIFGTGDFGENCTRPGGNLADGKKVYAVDRYGKPLLGWPVTTNANMYNAPALGDLDNDGKPEVVIHTLDTLYAWHGDGSPVQGFPVHNGEFHVRFASPVLADIDGDSEIEILLRSGQVYGPTGKLEQTREKLQGQLVVTDQDNDGLFETIGVNHYNYDFGWHLRVYVFQEPGLATGAAPWPMFHRTLNRNGVLPILYTLSGRIVNESGQGVSGVQVKLDNGRTAISDGQGKYIFGSLLPGSYTATPSYQNNLFKPKSRSIGVEANVTLENFVMHEPVFDIQGKVLQANGSYLAGVTMRLSTGETLTTGQNIFSFNDQQPGEYTLTPVSPDLNYLPEERTLTAEDEVTQLFYALPQPVEGTLQPDSTTQISFDDTQGLATTVTFPEGIGDEDVVLTPLLSAPPNGYLAAGHTLNINLVGSKANAQRSIVDQGGEQVAIEIQIQYSQADLQKLLDAEELLLLWQSPDGWVDAAESCSAGFATDNNLASKTITVSVCQLGTYGLFAPVDLMYMPSLFGEN